MISSCFARRSVQALAVVGLLLPSTAVLAQSSPSKKPADEQAATSSSVNASSRADAHFRRGKALYSEGNKREAYEAYKAAWDLKQAYDIAGNLGNVELDLGMMRDAAEHLSYCKRNFPQTGTDEQRARLDERLATARRAVGVLWIDVSASGAAVSLDGKAVGTSPLEAEAVVEAGAHRVEARLKGYRSAGTTMQVTAGVTHTVRLELVPANEAPRIEANPGWRPSPAYLIVGGAVAAAGLGAGVAFTAVANGKASDADALRGSLNGDNTACSNPPSTANKGTCAELRSRLESQGTFSNLALASFVIGGAFALGTGGLAAWTLLSPARPQGDADKTTARVVPLVDATSRGIAVVGAW